MESPATTSEARRNVLEQWRWPAASVLLAAWVAMLLLGGNALDRSLIRDWHLSQPPWILPVIFTTRLGDWEILVSLTFLVAGWLIYRRRWQAALFLAGSTLLGRLVVAIQKAALGRARPELADPLIVEESFAYPSGHAANSMIVYLLLAFLLAEGPRRRLVAAGAAVLLSLLIGATRVLLGVHWLTDVVGGWAFGLLWVLLCLRIAKYWNGPGTVPKRFTEG